VRRAQLFVLSSCHGCVSSIFGLVCPCLIFIAHGCDPCRMPWALPTGVHLVPPVVFWWWANSTDAGSTRSSSVPSPSCPYETCPKAHTLLATVTTTVFKCPQTTAIVPFECGQIVGRNNWTRQLVQTKIHGVFVLRQATLPPAQSSD